MSAVADVGSRAAAGPSAAPRARSTARAEGHMVLRFLVLSVVHLFIGTVQGVIQTFPGVAQWLREAGSAGHLIDPLAHAHINLVGGVTMGMMGIIYHMLPGLTGRTVYSPALAGASFWLSTVGVLGFFFSLVGLGVVEGNMIHAGMTNAEALDAVGPIHHVLIIATAFLMGFGYWAFISNVLLTVANKRGG